jgi:hypothetical protein
LEPAGRSPAALDDRSAFAASKSLATLTSPSVTHYDEGRMALGAVLATFPAARHARPPETVMNSHDVRSPEPDPELVRNLKLTVRRLPHRANRWAWDLRDGRDGSWFESMLEFDSPARARRSGLSRMEELLRAVSGVTAPAAPLQRKEPIVFLEAA